MRKWLRKLIGKNPAKVMMEINELGTEITKGDGKMTYKQTDRDLIIELAYTVAKLERKVDRLEEALEKTDGKAEMLIDDVVMLDERTQPLTDDGAKEFAEGLSDVIEEYVNDRITRDQIRRAYD